MAQNKVLIVHHDPDIQNKIVLALSGQGFLITSALDSEGALFQVVTGRPDLIIVDLASASQDHILQRVRRLSSVPLLGLVPPNDQNATVVGLEGGADQVLASPFHPQELCARARALLRRG